MSSSKFELICHPYGCIEEIDGMRLQDIVIAVYILCKGLPSSQQTKVGQPIYVEKIS